MALSFPPVASAQEVTRWLQNFLHLLSLTSCSLCPPGALSLTPSARTQASVHTDPEVGSFQALPGSGPVTWSPQEVLAPAAPCRLWSPRTETLLALRSPWEAVAWLCPLPGPQDSMTQGPSQLSDLGKLSIPPLGPCSHWHKGDGPEPDISDCKAL